MAATTARRPNTNRIGEEPIPGLFNFPQKGATTAWAGAIGVLSGGYAAPATTALNLKCVGRFEQSVVNAGADGATSVDILQGVLGPFANSAAADAITQTEVGTDCFLVDDQTLAKTNGGGTRSRAGVVIKVTSEGVWALMGLAV